MTENKSLGIDIVEVEKIKNVLIKYSRFMERVFTTDEIKYCENQISKYQHYAARFAAKEAVMKAIGTGWSEGVQWKDIEVISSNGQRPTIRLRNRAQVHFENLNALDIALSISHVDKYAVAIASIR